MSLDYRQDALTVPQAACIFPSGLPAASSRGRIVTQRHNRFEQSVGILGCGHCSGTRYLAALLSEATIGRPAASSVMLLDGKTISATTLC